MEKEELLLWAVGAGYSVWWGWARPLFLSREVCFPQGEDQNVSFVSPWILSLFLPEDLLHICLHSFLLAYLGTHWEGCADLQVFSKWGKWNCISCESYLSRCRGGAGVGEIDLTRASKWYHSPLHLISPWSRIHSICETIIFYLSFSHTDLASLCLY